AKATAPHSYSTDGGPPISDPGGSPAAGADPYGFTILAEDRRSNSPGSRLIPEFARVATSGEAKISAPFRETPGLDPRYWLRAVTRLTAREPKRRDRQAVRSPRSVKPAGAHPEAKAAVREGVMLRILVLLVAVTMGCGVAAGVTVAHAPVHAIEVEQGY